MTKHMNGSDPGGLSAEEVDALIYVKSDGDRNRAEHHYEGMHCNNQELTDESIKARKETVKNMQTR